MLVGLTFTSYVNLYCLVDVRICAHIAEESRSKHVGNHRFLSAGATSKKSCRNVVNLVNRPGKSL